MKLMMRKRTSTRLQSYRHWNPLVISTALGCEMYLTLFPLSRGEDKVETKAVGAMFC
jgi:hypothetical protein